MPTKRSNGRYYIQRKLPGIGKEYRSLQTDRKGVARRREDAVLALAERGRQDVVRAWLDGDVSIAELHEAHDAGRVHELAARVRRDDASLADACRAALRDKAPDVTDSTLGGYETGLERFRSFAADEGIEDVREALTTDAVQRFKAWSDEELDVADETVNNYLTAVSVLVSYAERRGWIDERPEIRKYESKVRISYLEAEDLTPSDLRLGNGEARAAIEDAKTPSGVRTVFLSPAAAEAVRGHVERHGRERDEPIFNVPRRTTQKEHDRARKRIGRPGYTIHDHRHTAAVHLARAGMPLHLLRQQLGHANVEQTMRYARFHPDYGDVAEYFDRADRQLGLRGDRGEDGAGRGGREVRRAASLLGVSPERLTRALDAPSTSESDNSSDNTPAPERREVEGVEIA